MEIVFDIEVVKQSSILAYFLHENWCYTKETLLFC